MEIKSLQDILSLIKSVVIALVMVSAILFVYVKANTISNVFFELVERMGSAEIAGVKVTFGEKGFVLNPDIAKLSLDDRLKVVQSLKSLSPDEFNRLLHMTEYDKQHVSDEDINCDYDKATAQMRLFSAADQGLSEKHLVEQNHDPKLTTKKRAEVEDIRKKTGKPLDIGSPSDCYQMTLTNTGRDLKSLMVSELTRVFGPNMRAE
jgi:hypothetical protein